MSLAFDNEYSASVSISILWYSPGCPDGGDWELAGWCLQVGTTSIPGRA
jgi:hypothetical protein